MNKFGCFLPMFVQKMSVHFPNQNSAILMTQPRRDGHKVDARHDANRTEVMTEIVKSNPLQARGFARNFQTLPKALRVFIPRTALRGGEKPRAIWRAAGAHFA